MNGPDRDGDRQVSTSLLAALIEYLRRAGGAELVTEVEARAGGPPLSELMARKWGSRQQLLAIADAAAEIAGDPEMGRRTGEEMFRMNVSDPATTAFFVSFGSPASALGGVLEYTVNMGRGRSYRIVSSDDAGCVIKGDYEDRVLGHPFFCGLSLGYWPMLATLFGAVGTSTHPECQCRGDEHCTFVIRWDPGAAADPSQLAQADIELRRRVGSFEQMQAGAEELARAADLPALAERILDAVDTITPAPQLLVAIRASDDKPAVVAARGMSRRAARSLAATLLEGSHDASIPVSAMARLGSFGVVAALAPDARAESDMASRLLDAFARHAGARIEAVLSRQLAEESRQTASALLLLARSLAETTTEVEVSECVAQAIPRLVAADHSAVLRWDPNTRILKTMAFVCPEPHPPHEDFTIREVPALYEMASRPTPFVLHRSEATGFLARAMQDWDEEISVVVPVVEHGDFLGFVSAGYRAEMHLDDAAAFARLQGAADLAATAFTKARLVEEIRHQALHDWLTGLPNRVLLEDRVRQSLREARRYRRRMAILFLDLDRFKNVNDSMGHEFGDVLIQVAAERIGEVLRESDIFARMGGDEFVIALPDVDGADEASLVAKKILAELQEPFEISGQSLYISASIGVAVYPDDGNDYGALLQAADSSMYEAKDSGRNTVRRRQPPTGSDRNQNRLSVETELHQALERDELRVVYQPQVAMADLKLTGVEALVRWAHPRLGELPPSEFLSVAEECGLMPQVDRLVRRAALTQARAWHDAAGPLVVAINLAAQNLRRSDLLDEISDDIERSGVDPAAVEVELTEGMVADDDLIPVVEGLAEIGVRVAIDDFGTGASVFARLQRLPVHRLKIDRSLVQGHEVARDSSIVAAIIEMSHSLGLEVVAEGVESPVQAGRLRRAGCDFGQGYLFGRPAPDEEIDKIISSQLASLDRPGFAVRASPSGPIR